MAFIILSLITVVALFIVLGISFAVKKWRARPRQLLSLFGCLWLLAGMFVVVPMGHAGILTTEPADYNIDIVRGYGFLGRFHPGG